MSRIETPPQWHRRCGGVVVPGGRPMTSGQVTEVLGGVYTVRLESGFVEASLRGRLKLDERRGDKVVIGDSVEIAAGEAGEYTIESVHPRRTWLTRRTLGGRVAKIVAANLDRLIVVASVVDPRPSREVIDRMLVMGESGGLEVVLVLTKTDLLQDEEGVRTLVEAYRAVGYPVISTSVRSRRGIDEFERLICAGSSALVGPSGVGKSTLVNAVEPTVSLRTREVGRRSRTGKHTTVSSRLIALGCGGLVADTPGFSDVGLGDVDPEALDACFPEFRPFLGSCRFRDCLHVHEPDCAVVAAVDRGDILQGRYRSYRAILEEVGSG